MYIDVLLFLITIKRNFTPSKIFGAEELYFSNWPLLASLPNQFKLAILIGFSEFR